MIEKTIKSERIYEGRILNLRKDWVELPNGVQSTREIVEHRPAVVVLPFQEPDPIYLIRQYRKPMEKVLIETVAGLIENQEPPLDAAKRELKEETGFIAKTWIPLYEGYPTPGFCTEYMYLFLAKDLEKSNTEFDHDEMIELFPCSVKQLDQMIHKNEIIDIKTVFAYLLAKPYF